MCGIVGYVGPRDCSDVLVSALTRLEYRGYDSAGIAVFEDGKIEVAKTKGRLKDLSEKMEREGKPLGHAGIGHTRWATHGQPSDINSHPHSGERVTIVHNGIIENYIELKDYLLKKGRTFLSETDTEVVAQLLDYKYNGDPIDTIHNVIRMLKGSFAFGIVFADYPDVVYAVRRESPLIVGIGEEKKECFIASDVPAILNYTKKYYLMDHDEIVKLSHDGVEFFDSHMLPVTKELQEADWDMDAAEKGGYPHFMIKEIHEQPDSIKRTIIPRILNGMPDLSECGITVEKLREFKNIHIVACGTAMHAGLSGKIAIEKLCKIPVTVDIASEFRYRNPIIDENTLCIYISQSGETADTIAALKLAKSKGATTLAISNVIGSSITREADYCIYTHAGPEIAVASTKAYTSQVVLLDILAIYFAEILESASIFELKELKKEMLSLPAKIENALKSANRIKEFAKNIYQEKDVFFLGRGVDYNTALEGSLKLKEISYIHSEAYAAGELKHGPIALIENSITVISIITDKALVEKTISNIQEVITRGAKTLVITNQELPSNNIDTIITVPDTNVLFSPILAIVPLQLLSYYISKEKGLDVDKPRNLAKSVTVE